MAVDPLAAAGFGAREGHYDAGRPPYSSALVDLLVSELDIGPGRRVLDLAAGNGRLTRALVATGAALVALEPVGDMRQAFAANSLGVPLAGAVAEALPIGRSSLDAVTVGQAFHWFRAREALVEIGRVLRPGGGLALVWYERDQSVRWVRALDEATRWNELRPSSLGVDWPETLLASGLFGEPHGATLREALVVDRATLDAHVRSISYVAAMPDAERDAILARVGDVVAGFPAEFSLPFVVQTYWCRRLK